MSARRSLLTTAAAGALLGALCFVPSANATSPDAAPSSDSSSSSSSSNPSAPSNRHETASAASGRLAETGGGFDTTPYVVGGTAFLGLGAGFVVFSVRRERDGESGGRGSAAY
ncbi:hypothetical protein ABZV77_06505 [Streptomyces sp. NPDC004732]|uniref:hypothetical protein n=1 Tax=Streptomyces sp. NPDC004732 TaxID=3154290 RepID=UPI0033B4B433